MADILIYSTPWCPFCIRAKHLLKSKGAPFTDIDVSGKPDLRKEMEQKAGAHTVPQIWIGETHVGGCDELYALERQGQLDALLQA
ncbi:MAG: glutaredoxin 3 [Pseudomonadota bacterium]|nr:glutaredoxin 3 [Pseudomonadales bacterium]MDY6920177.1 glutaredoxin 3 [Pseudomonadota bacterium]